MARFPLVPIGTSNPVTLVDGLELLPGIMPERSALQVSNSSQPLFDFAFPILFGRWKVSAYSQLLLGVVGPAIAFLFEPVTVTTQNQRNRGEVVLDFSGIQTSNAQSGFVLGAAFSAGVHIVLEFYLPARWYQPWKFKWFAVFDKRFTFTIDLCNLLVKLIRYLINRSPNGAQKGDISADPTNPLGSRLLNKATSFRLFDEVNTRFPASRTLTPAPKLTIPWNMVDCVPVLAQFVKALQAIKGDLVIGPCVSVQFPTTLGLTGLTVEGGQSTGSTADYGPLTYTSTTVTGSGPPFTSATPTRLITRVNYQTQVSVLLSCLFYVSVAKVFSRGRNTPSLDLLRLLRLPRPTLGSINNSVSSQLSDRPVVFVPQLRLSVFNPDGNPAPINARVEPSKINVELRNPWTGPGALLISLSNDQNLPGFPSQLTVPVNQIQGSAQYTFPSRAVATGNPDQPDETQSATPTLESYTVRITARASREQIGERARDFENTQAVWVVNPIINIQPIIIEPFQQAEGPVWNRRNGQYVNPSNPGFRDLRPPGFKFASFRVTWAASLPPTAVPVRFTLLSEEREPWASSAVSVMVRPGSGFFPLRPTAIAHVIASSFGRWEFTINWDSTGRDTGFSNRFIVVVDAGPDFGQDEVWLYLSAWS